MLRKPQSLAKALVIGVGALLVLAPIAFVLTIILSPLWSWIERRYGIESIGHSGPSDWCFWLTYAVLVASAGAFALAIRRPGHVSSASSRESSV
jgi:hypothetical protein